MFPAFLVQIVIVLIIVGLVLWVVAQIPMDAAIARIIRVVVIVAVCLWLLSILLGYAGSGPPLIRTR
jgi:uncharacterized membrane protein